MPSTLSTSLTLWAIDQLKTRTTANWGPWTLFDSSTTAGASSWIVLRTPASWPVFYIKMVQDATAKDHISFEVDATWDAVAHTGTGAVFAGRTSANNTVGTATTTPINVRLVTGTNALGLQLEAPSSKTVVWGAFKWTPVAADPYATFNYKVGLLTMRGASGGAWVDGTLVSLKNFNVQPNPGTPGSFVIRAFNVISDSGANIYRGQSSPGVYHVLKTATVGDLAMFTVSSLNYQCLPQLSPVDASGAVHADSGMLFAIQYD